MVAVGAVHGAVAHRDDPGALSAVLWQVGCLGVCKKDIATSTCDTKSLYLHDRST